MRRAGKRGGQQDGEGSGLYWHSYEPFGWAVYHYGRWAWWDPRGWVWIPDKTWG
ncbi:MAG: DUF6600 domain-containing protein, partial [Phycisphaerales bacterium]